MSRKQWSCHKDLCAAITSLAVNFDNANTVKTAFVSHITPQKHSKLIKLVGEKCLVECLLNGNKTFVLWDTGSQISILSQQYLTHNFPQLEVKDLKKLLGEEIELDLRAANNSSIPYSGYVELEINVCNKDSPGLSVPFLVTKSRLARPQLRYNVIEELVRKESNIDFANPNKVIDRCVVSNNMVEVMFAIFPNQGAGDIENLIDCLTVEDEFLSTVRSPKRTLIIPAKQRYVINGRTKSYTAEAKTPVLFEPDENDTLPPGLELSHMSLQISRGASNRIKLEIENTTNHPISLHGRTVLGRLELITSITPMLVKLKTDTDEARDMPDELHKPDCTTKTGTIDIKAADH